MKLAKTLSLILCLSMLMSIFAGLHVANAVGITDAGLTDVAINGNFDAALADTWALSSSAEGALSIVDDSKDSSNKVLRYDGTSNTKDISYINYTCAEPNKTYYMTLKVRMADVESNTGDMFIYAASLGKIGKNYYSSTRPQVTKDGWSIISGVVTTSGDTANIGFKATTKATASSGENINYPTAVYEIDDFALYDMEGYHKVTLPSGVSAASGVSTINGVIYAKSGDTVVLNCSTTGVKLVSDQATIAKDSASYRFTMPDADVTVEVAGFKTFENLILNGDMEGEGLAWKASSSTEGAVVSLVQDSQDPTNHVLRYDGTNITKGTTSFMSYADVLTTSVDTPYYFSYKIRLVESKTYTGDMYAYNRNHTEKTELDRPKLTTEWTTRSGIISKAKQTTYDFKVTKDIKDSGTNVTDVIYEIDDVVIYNLTDTYELTLPNEVRLTEGAKALDCTNSDFSTKTKYYAQAGETIKIEYKAEKRLSVLGTKVTKVGDIYSFTMLGAATTVTLAKPPFTNLILNGDMEGAEKYWNPSSSTTGAVTSLVEDSQNPGNHVMRYDGTNVTKASTSFMSYSDVLTKGKSYYYSYKIRLVESKTYEGDVYAYNRNHTATTELARPKLTTEWSTRSGFITEAKQTTYDFKVTKDIKDSNSNVIDVIYEIDDVVLYEVEYMNEIVLPEGAQLVAGGHMLPVTQGDLTTVYKCYATQDQEIKIRSNSEQSLSSLDVALAKNGDVYTFVMPDAAVTITATEPAFTNLIANGDMEGDANKWKASSTVTGAVVSLVEDSHDPTNQVLRYDGTNISAGKISYVTYSNVLTEGKSYYYSYKIRLVESKTYDGAVYSYNKNHTAHNDVARPELTTEWTTRSGVFTAKDTSYNFKITSSQEDSNENVADVIYELDDVVIYDFTYTHEIFVPAQATITTSKNVRTLPSSFTATQMVDRYFAEVGAEVNFTYSGDNGLKADTEMSISGDEYTFIMPEFPVTVAEVSAINFSVTEQIPNITVAKPQSFVVLVARYSESKDMEEVYIADVTSTANNQMISLDEIPEFSTITDWSGMYVYVWNNIFDMFALCDTFICEF